MKAKKVIIIVLIIVFAIMLFPLPHAYKDGGTIEYKAVLYEVTNYKSIMSDDSYLVGWEVKILGITVFDNTTEKPASEVFS